MNCSKNNKLRWLTPGNGDSGGQPTNGADIKHQQLSIYKYFVGEVLNETRKMAHI